MVRTMLNYPENQGCLGAALIALLVLFSRPAAAQTCTPCGGLLSSITSGTCYCVSAGNYRLTFFDAKLACRRIGLAWDLTSIGGPGENAFLSRSIARIGGRAWIGLTDYLQETAWIWPDRKVANYVFTAFAPGEPNGGRSENCAYLESSGARWHDANCDSMLPFVCKDFSRSYVPGPTQKPTEVQKVQAGHVSSVILSAGHTGTPSVTSSSKSDQFDSGTPTLVIVVVGLFVLIIFGIALFLGVKNRRCRQCIADLPSICCGHTKVEDAQDARQWDTFHASHVRQYYDNANTDAARSYDPMQSQAFPEEARSWGVDSQSQASYAPRRGVTEERPYW